MHAKVFGNPFGREGSGEVKDNTAAVSRSVGRADVGFPDNNHASAVITGGQKIRGVRRSRFSKKVDWSISRLLGRQGE